MTVRRQLRWIVWGTALGALPFALGYAIPFGLGVDPSVPMGLSAIPLGFIPLAFASAIIRYRLMDVEIILKRLLIYTSAVAAIVAIYVLILRASGGYLSVEGGETDHRWIIAFLATVVVILLAKPVKDGLQKAIDRAFYRDRYDYRQALVGFARELNSDLDLNRLADRLVTRVRETIELDRLAFLVATDAGDFESISHQGLESEPPRLQGATGIGSRLHSAHTVRLDDPLAATRFTAEEIEFWRDHGIYYFVPCVAKDAAIAVLALGRRGERRAAQHRRHRARHRRRRAGRDRDRKRPPLSAASSQGVGAGSPPRVQREHPRVARRWAAGDRAGRPGDPLERVARAALRDGAHGGARQDRSTACSTRTSSSCWVRFARSIPTATPRSACRSVAGAAVTARTCW